MEPGVHRGRGSPQGYRSRTLETVLPEKLSGKEGEAPPWYNSVAHWKRFVLGRSQEGREKLSLGTSRAGGISLGRTGGADLSAREAVLPP